MTRRLLQDVPVSLASYAIKHKGCAPEIMALTTWVRGRHQPSIPTVYGAYVLVPGVPVYRGRSTRASRSLRPPL
jgi:hypothetical protein